MNTELVDSSPKWVTKYLSEAEKVRGVVGNDLIDIQHIGSTAIPGVKAKPIIDIAVLISSYKVADKHIHALENHGYSYEPEKSSNERHFFRKGNPIEFHLSLAYKDRGSYWERQILFRDYLLDHPEKAKEYETLKFKLIEQDPTGWKEYLSGKNEFINEILDLAKK